MRLIDADKLVAVTLTDGGYWTKEVYYKADIDAAPTVYPPPNDPLTPEELREMDCEYCKEDSCELCVNKGCFVDCEWKPFNGEMCENYLRANYCRRCGRKLNP